MLAMITHAGGDTGQGSLRALRTITVNDHTPTAQTTACNGVAPNLLYRWRRLLSEGGAAAVSSDEPVVGSSEVRRLEERVRELERLPGRL
jgi:transposase-like protein